MGSSLHCVLHAKRGGWIQIACKIAFVLNGRPFIVLKRNKTTVVSAMILKVCTL